MSRKTGARSYLQQLAQPIAPTETVLSARPVAAAIITETSPVVPLIEDRFEMPDGAWTVVPPSPVPARRERLAMSVAPVSPTVEAEDGSVTRDAKAQHVFDRPAKARGAYADNQGRMAAAISPSESVSAGDVTVVAPQSQRERAWREGSSVAQSSVVETRLHHSSGTGDDSAQFRSESGAARQNESDTNPERVVEKRPALSAWSQYPQQGYIPERIANQPATATTSGPATAQSAKSEGRTDAGPRVHIGTIEIRAVLPQPPAPPPVVMAPSQAQNNGVAQGRGRSGQAEPLARGFDWSYGLVQG